MSIVLNRDLSYAEVPAAPVNTQDVWAENRSLSSRVGSAALRALAWLGMGIFMLAGTALTFGILPIAAAVQKYRSQARLEKMVDKMAIERFQAVYGAVRRQSIQDISSIRHTLFLPKKSLKSLKGTQSEKAKLLEHVRTLLYLLESNRIYGTSHDDMQKIRAHVNETLALPIYQRNKDQHDNYSISIFQAATHAFVSESPGMAPMQEVGANAVGNIDGDITFGVVADKLEKAYEDFTIFKKASRAGKIFWIYAHPMKFMASAMDQQGLTRPVDYNSYEHGNAAIKVGKFKVGSFFSGYATYTLGQNPTLTGDRLTAENTYRPSAYSRTKNALIPGAPVRRIVQDLESNYHGHEGERGRVAAKQSLHDADHLIHLNTPINLHKDGTDTHALGPSHPLRAVIGKAIAKSKLKGKWADKAQLLAEVSLRGIEEMIAKPFQNGDHYINQSCKQNIDRGVIVNVMTILFADKINGTPITEERVHQVVGMVLARAGMVDDRAILKKWFMPLIDLLKVLDNDPAVIDKVRNYFGGGAIAFTASSH